MLLRGRGTTLGVACLVAVAMLVPAGCASRSGATAGDSASAASAGGSAGPVVLTGATLMTDGEVPRLLLSAAGPLSPTVFTRDEGRTVVVDLADVVSSPGMEPPRADGRVLSQVGLRSFSEMGRPHVQVVLVGRASLEVKVAGDPATTGATLALVTRKAAPPAPVAVAAATPVPQASAAADAAPAPVSSPAPAVAPVAPPAPAFAAGTTPVVLARHTPSGSSATRLQAVSSRKSERGTVFALSGDGEFAYEAFTLGNPPRFVLDLAGVRQAARVKVPDVGRSGLVTKVRVSQFRTEPSPVARVVFDLAAEVVPLVRQTSSGLVVEFSGAPTPAPVTMLASAAPAVPSREPAAPRSGSYEAREETDPHEPVVGAAPRAEPPAPMPVSRSSSGAAPVIVTEPAPVVVAASAPEPVPVTPPPAEAPAPVAVAAAAPPAAPAPAAPTPVAPETPAAPAATVAVVTAPAASAAVVSAPPAPVAVAEAQAAPPVAVVARPEPVPAPQVAPMETKVATTAPRPAPRKKPQVEDRLLVEAAETLLDEQDKGGSTRDLTNPYESRALGGGDRQYTGEPLTLNLKDADIKDTLQKFSELTNLNIVLDPDVRGTVTVTLNDIPWDQALELILKINGLGYVLEGNVMRIAPTAKLAGEEQQRQSLVRAQEQNRPTKTVIQKLSYASVGEASAVARKVMSPRGDIFSDERSNTLIIKELPEYLPTVLDLIRNLDQPVPQVMIEARVVEATRSFLRQFGINWKFRSTFDQTTGNTTGLVFPNSGSVAGQVALENGTNLLNFSLANVLDTFRLDMAISAAESKGLAKLISTPRIQTQTNKAATIQSGVQLPVQTTVNNTTTVLYVDATLNLNVTPQITSEGTVILNVKIARREPVPGISIAGGNNVPLITRDAQTTVMVRDGGTAVIGGIFKLTANDGQSMIPGLWKIPLLGNLFKNRTIKEDTDELMIFITPRVMKNY